MTAAAEAGPSFPVLLRDGRRRRRDFGRYVHHSGHGVDSPSSRAHRTHRADRGLVWQDEDDDVDVADGALGIDGEGLGGGAAEAVRIATTGEVIAAAPQFMRGHGTYLGPAATSSSSSASASTSTTSAPHQLIHSSLCGVVTRTNRLVSVRAVSQSSRYAPEVGDLVLGRILSVQYTSRRWKVDIGSCYGDASLSLASINLPGGVQRRKLESDELQMRQFFKEADLVVAEVQALHHSDGSAQLHTRSLRYGKLRNGRLVRVPPRLVARLRSHFVALHNGADVELLLGLNGWVWVSKRTDAAAAATASSTTGGNASEGTAAKATTGEQRGLAGSGAGMDIDGVYSDVNEPLSHETQHRLHRVALLLCSLARRNVVISQRSVQLAWDVSLEWAALPTFSVDDGEIAVAVAAAETRLTEVVEHVVRDVVKALAEDASSH